MSGTAKKAMKESAASQTRIAATQEREADRLAQEAQRRAAIESELFGVIRPSAEKMIGAYNPDTAYAERPDNSAMIRRDYFDDLAGIQEGENAGAASALDALTANNLGRSGRVGSVLGSVAAGAGRDRSLARRTMQQRSADDKMDAYYDNRAQGQEKSQIALAGMNVLAGQQGQFDPVRYEGLSANTRNAAVNTNSQAADSSFRASQIPGTWSKIGGALGGVAATALSPVPGGSLVGKLWK